MKIVLTKGHGNTSITVNGENVEDITNAEIRDYIEQAMRTVKDKEKLITFLLYIVTSVGKFGPSLEHQEFKTDGYKFEIDI